MCCGLSFFLYPYLERIKFDYSVGNPNNLKKFKKVFYGRIVPGERSNKNRTVTLWDSKIYGTFPRMSGSMSHSGRVIEAWEEDILRAFSVWKGGKGAPNMPFGWWIHRERAIGERATREWRAIQSCFWGGGGRSWWHRSMSWTWTTWATSVFCCPGSWGCEGWSWSSPAWEDRTTAWT